MLISIALPNVDVDYKCVRLLGDDSMDVNYYICRTNEKSVTMDDSNSIQPNRQRLHTKFNSEDNST